VKRGDIVIAVHGELGRPRPVVIVQANELGESTTTVVVCPITSELTPRLPIRPIIEPSALNGLHTRSQIMTDKPFSLPRERVRRVLGRLESDTNDALDRALLTVFGLIR
jgi:mRNA interferase MazF